MDKIIPAFEKLNLQMSNIEEAMIVLPHKPNLMETIKELSDNNRDAKDLEVAVKESLNDHHKHLKKEYKETKKLTEKVQMKMVFLLQHFEDKEKHEMNERRALQEIRIPGTPKLLERKGALQAFSESNTPRMMIADYAKSPFAKKRSKIQLQFTDFEAEVTIEEFNKIPGYMRGRSCLSELQEFLDNVVIRTFNEKYQILFKQRASLKPSEYTLQTMFRDQSTYFEGSKFITVGDLARVLEKNVDKKDERHLQMLRHLQIIREARKNSTCCYIWLKK